VKPCSIDVNYGKTLTSTVRTKVHEIWSRKQRYYYASCIICCEVL